MNRGGAGIGVSIAAIIIGAVFRYAVFATPWWASVQTVGLILLIAGSIGLVVSVTVAVATSIAAGRSQRETGYERGKQDSEEHWEREIIQLRHLHSIESHDRYNEGYAQGRADERAQQRPSPPALGGSMR
jgi:hypothetical protein